MRGLNHFEAIFQRRGCFNSLSLMAKTCGVTIQTKPLQHFFHMVQCIFFSNIIPSFIT